MGCNGMPRPARSVESRRAFLVVEPDLLIARDLRETLEGLDPGASVVVATSAEEARAALEGLDRITAGLLSLPREALRSGEIPRAVEGRGGRVVVLDAASPPEAGIEDQGRWIHTGRPFATGAIAEALHRVRRAS